MNRNDVGGDRGRHHVWSSQWVAAAHGEGSSSGSSSSSRHLLTTQPLHTTLYPSRMEIDAVDIPSCASVFASSSTLQRRQRPTMMIRDEDDARHLVSSFQTLSTTSCSNFPPSYSLSPERFHRPTTDHVYGDFVPRNNDAPTNSYGAFQQCKKNNTVLESLSVRDTKRQSLIPVNEHHHRMLPGSISVDQPAYLPYEPEELDDGALSLSPKRVAASVLSSSLRAPPLLPRPAAEIEVSPGVFMRLHGTEETVAAMQANTLVMAGCMCCAADLWCVPVARFVLCPTCKVLSPVRDDDDGVGGGVGLGLGSSHYAAWQDEASATQSSSSQPDDNDHSRRQAVAFNYNVS